MSLSGTSTVARMPIGAEMSLTRVTDVVRRHSIGILVALALAAVLVSPRWWVLALDPSDGVRVPISPYGAGSIGYDESLYSASIRQAYDGDLPVSDPYLVNHHDDAPQRSAFPHEAIGLLGRVTGGAFPALAIVTTIAAAAALLLLYFMLYQITGSRWIAAGLMPIVLLGVQVLNHAEGILPLRHREILAPLVKVDPLREVHVWGRFPAPILMLAPFFAAVIAFPRAVQDGDRRWMAVAAVAFASMIYVYVYYWTAFGLALALWLAVLLVQREVVHARRLMLAAVGGTLLALPELAILAQTVGSLPEDARARVGLEDPGVDVSMAMTLAQRFAVGLPFIAAALLMRPRQIFFVALFVAPLMLGALTGLVPQPWHYHTQVWGVFAIPVVAVGVAAAARSEVLQRFVRPAAIAFGIVAVLSLGYAVALQGRAIVRTDEAYAVSEDEDAALSWIRSNVGDDETVVSPSITTNMLLGGLTRASQYLGEGGFSTAKDAELMERILRAQAAFGYREETAFGRLQVHNEFDGFPVNDAKGTSAKQERELEDYLAFFTFSFEISDKDAFTNDVDAWRPRYEDLLSSEGVLSEFPADYLYCGHRERFFPADAVARGTWVRVAHSSGDYTIYELVEAGTPGAFEFSGCG